MGNCDVSFSIQYTRFGASGDGNVRHMSRGELVMHLGHAEYVKKSRY